MNVGNFIEGAALLISVGLNGLAIQLSKEQHNTARNQEAYIEELVTEVKLLRKKTTPWNKGKSGYKHKPRYKHKPSTTITLLPLPTPVETSAAGGYTSESQL
jgi:hypothetical protein